MAGFQNGRIPRSALVAIPGGLLRNDAALAWTEMRAEIIRRGGPPLAPTGPISSYRNFDGQVLMRNFWCGKGKCGNAAVPGTSNHGWGLAVDVATPQMEDWILRLGSRFGWSHAEGARVGESWHFTYVGGFVRTPDPNHVLTSTERSWITELSTTKNPLRKRELRHKIAVQLTVIKRAAQRGGWQVRHRRARFDLLRRYV
jgi:hypothetical protein